MIHQYQNNGYNIVLDVNSGAVHVVDQEAYDVIEVLNRMNEDHTVETLKSPETAEALKKELGEKYSEKDLLDILEAVTELTEQGRLAEDDPASLAPGQFTTQSQVTRLPDGSMQVLRVLLKDPDGQADRWHLLAWEDGAFTLIPQPVPDLAYLLMREHHTFANDAPYMSSQLLLSQ